ncbi:MAG: hypothetical protein A2293_08695 [Elusimicrobia bacterium RIFOXYB2_FULL_49_7]|nr:MAG: hypothetical protein A2293_08695 [Elusimicrobia bacterium RIFOXYB2_FULL_49_7]
MKKSILTLAVLSTLGMGVTQAETFTDSWELGAGLSYPRLSSANITTGNADIGAYVAIQRNYSEHVGLRLKGVYAHLQGKWTDAAQNTVTAKTNLITTNLDLLYYLDPCSRLSPYLFGGLGGNVKFVTHNQTDFPDNNKFGSQLNLGTGAEFKINSTWSVGTEFGYHITNNSELDGTIVPAEMNGRDSYLALNVGVNYFFGKGRISPECDACQTIVCQDLTDYRKIEELIMKHIPKEVDRYIMAIAEDILVLVGVNFDFDKSNLLPESYPVLDKAVTLLIDQPTVKVEIQGYTDFVGTIAYNQELSVDRAITVKTYLVSKGIAADRLTTVGYGMNNPVQNNKTEEGRAMNRRIVFKIIK